MNFSLFTPWHLSVASKGFSCILWIRRKMIAKKRLARISHCVYQCNAISSQLYKFSAKLAQFGRICQLVNIVILIHGRTKKLAREGSVVAKLLCCWAENNEMNNRTSSVHSSGFTIFNSSLIKTKTKLSKSPSNMYTLPYLCFDLDQHCRIIKCLSAWTNCWSSEEREFPVEKLWLNTANMKDGSYQR